MVINNFKNITLTIILILKFSLAFSQTIEQLDQKYGYKDLNLEIPRSSIENKIFDCTENGHCLLLGESYKSIDDSKVENTFVKFSENKLFAIFINLKGAENIQKFVKVYKAAYGEPTSFDAETQQIFWEGEKTIVVIQLSVDPSGVDRAQVTMAAKSLMKANRINPFQKAIDDL